MSSSDLTFQSRLLPGTSCSRLDSIYQRLICYYGVDLIVGVDPRFLMDGLGFGALVRCLVGKFFEFTFSPAGHGCM